MSDRLLTARELGAVLGLSASTILDHFEAGDLPGFKLFQRADKLGRQTGAVRFRESEIIEWIEAQRVPCASEGKVGREPPAGL
jgi:predicted DNA-binding transcriptional regulator AlpA